MNLPLIVVFCLLIVSFSIIVVMIFLNKRNVKFPILAAVMTAISLLGAALIFLALKQDVAGILKIFLILAGAAPATMIISTILHNAISGLLTHFLKREVEEAVFFLIAIFGCPAAFLVGVVGSIVMMIRMNL